MFGGNAEVPKFPTHGRQRPPLLQRDLWMPHTSDGTYAHRARNPNTDYAAKMLLNRLREHEDHKNSIGSADKLNYVEMSNIQAQERAEKNRFKNHIKERLNQKLEHYEANVERRREALRVLLGDEERELIRETVDLSQKAEDTKLEEMKTRCDMLRQANEKERLEIVKKKRIQQYANRCMELRPVMIRKHLVESKLGQLQQMKDNEVRRETERELDRMWQDVQRREDLARLEKETQDALMKHERDRKDQEILQMQIEGKRLLELERKAVEQSDREEMLRQAERLKRQEDEDNKQRLLKRQKESNDLKKQLQSKKQFEALRKQEEQALEDAFKALADIEFAKEKQKAATSSLVAKLETRAYRQHLMELAKQQKDDEKKFDEMVIEYQKSVNAVEDKKQCKLIQAKRKLAEEVLKGRFEQLTWKRKEAEKELEFKKKENEAIRQAMDVNKKLDVEAARLAKRAAQEYRQDLQKQIEYNNLLRKREMEDMKKKLQQGMEEENKYLTMVDSFINGTEYSDQLSKHPFRRVLERYDCYCKTDGPK
ncbi:PREDICTED: cilia- and flagella-associated protein 53-like [Nicrophorus vespilloides]|uniref:Cilia- and flagella-associated protein 53-like n=1 Tax=Nicrophorus vespilloides TaxID=110193 RepID=A0ABM1MCL0_NICVS|nr:PREDICTED: cilia- and flagella-associated protein 53-like [Nicrophorus vespilloides]